MRLFWTVALLGFFALGSSMEVRRLSPPAVVRPGDFVTQVWRITNHTPELLTLRIHAELPEGWEALGLPEALLLGPGEEDYLFLVLYVPRGAKSGAHTVRLRIRWDGEEAVAEAPIEVEAVAALSLFPPPAEGGEPGESLAFSVRVVNRGNAVDRVAITVRTASGWPVEVRPAELLLAPGEAGEARVTLRIPSEAPVGREVVLAQARSGLSPELAVRTAWYVEVLPPGPARVPQRIHAELAMVGFGRFAYDFLGERGTSFLGFSGRGAVLDGALELSGRWAGPWAPRPLQLLDLQAVYVTDRWEVEAGRVGFSFPALLAPLGFWGLSARLAGDGHVAAFGSGGEGESVRAGAYFLLRASPWEAGGAYREERGAAHVRAGTVGLGLSALESLRFGAVGGAAQVQGLTRFAGELRLTWEIPELFFLEVRGFALDPRFPALVQDRAGLSLSGRLGAAEAGFRFLWEWQRDNLRGLSPTTRAWHGVQAGWDLFPQSWPLRLGFALSLRRTADLSFPPALDERVARAEGLASFSHQGFTVGVQVASTRLQDLVAARGWWRGEFREWLELRPSERVVFRGEFQQVLFSAPGEERRQGEASFSFSWDERFRVSWSYGREGGTARAEATVEPAPVLTLKLGAEARWREAGEPSRFAAFLEFAYRFTWAPPFLPVHGLLSGHVFSDLNGNGERDPTEPGVPGVILGLGDLQVSSGEDGEFRFPGQPPGSYVLRVVRVPLGYALPDEELPVALALGRETRVSVPLLPLASLSGIVFLDLDGDGVPALGEPGLPRVYVRIGPAEGPTLEVLTDPTGRFLWPELRPGHYRVELVLESLPARHEPTTPAVLELALGPGEKKEVAFGVRERPKPVVVIQPPLAEFTWTPLVPKAGEPVLFDATPSQAFGAEIVEYLWDFNDDGEADAEGVRVSWAFPEPGLYLVTLVVVDSAGLTGRTQYLLQVRSP